MPYRAWAPFLPVERSRPREARFFGLLGKEDDIIITCDDIEIIGVDTVLISVDEANFSKRQSDDLKILFK